MKPIFAPLVALALLLAPRTSVRAQGTAPKTDSEKYGYALGAQVARNLKQTPVDVDLQAFIAGVHDVQAGNRPAMTPDQMQEALLAFNREVSGGSKNRKGGEAFLAANKSKPGIQTLPDGLQYKIVQEGSGPSPTASDSVTVKYRGTLIDGTVFDDSEKHGGTATFPVSGVIAGWTEALLKMKPGAKWKLFIPSELAYGSQGAGTQIGPDTTLIFDVELVSIVRK